MLWKSLLAAASAAVAAAQTLTISFVQSTPLKAVDSFSYLNYNIDTGSIYNGFDWLDPKLIAISRQLGPAILRIGGTANDYSVYIPDSTNPQGGPARTGSVTIISDAILDNIVYFMQETNLTLLWDFNGLTFRNGAGPWNPNGNATQMLDHFQKKFGGQVCGCDIKLNSIEQPANADGLAAPRHFVTRLCPETMDSPHVEHSYYRRSITSGPSATSLRLGQ